MKEQKSAKGLKNFLTAGEDQENRGNKRDYQHFQRVFQQLLWKGLLKMWKTTYYPPYIFWGPVPGKECIKKQPQANPKNAWERCRKQGGEAVTGPSRGNYWEHTGGRYAQGCQ
jgi:hypothetical protein